MGERWRTRKEMEQIHASHQAPYALVGICYLQSWLSETVRVWIGMADPGRQFFHLMCFVSGKNLCKVLRNKHWKHKNKKSIKVLCQTNKNMQPFKLLWPKKVHQKKTRLQRQSLAVSTMEWNMATPPNIWSSLPFLHKPKVETLALSDVDSAWQSSHSQQAVYHCQEKGRDFGVQLYCHFI